MWTEFISKDSGLSPIGSGRIASRKADYNRRMDCHVAERLGGAGIYLYPLPKSKNKSGGNMERELEKDLMEIQCVIKEQVKRDNIFIVSVLQRCYKLVSEYKDLEEKKKLSELPCEVVDKLKKYAAEYNLPPFGREVEGTPELLLEAAKMIEVLSAKLAAVNMELESLYESDGGWIPVKEKLPENNIAVLIQVNGEYENITFENAFEFASYSKIGEWELEAYPDWTTPNVVAWMSLPKPYHEF